MAESSKGPISVDIPDEDEAHIAKYQFGEPVSGTLSMDEDEPPICPDSPKKSRLAISAEVISEQEVASFQHPVYPKSEDDAASLRSGLKGLALFSQLEDKELQIMIDAMSLQEYPAGQPIIQQGELLESDKTYFYFIDKGQCSLSIDGHFIRRLAEKDFFGELELLYGQPRTGTIMAETDVRCWTLNRNTYRVLMTSTFMKKREQYSEFLRHVGFLEGLTNQELAQLADALQPAVYKQGETLIELGTPGHWFSIIVEGNVEVRGRKEDGETIDVCRLGPGDCLGELEFIYHHKAVADVVAVTEEVRVAHLNRPHFELCMGPVVDMLKRLTKEGSKYSYYRALPASSLQCDDTQKECSQGTAVHPTEEIK